MSKFVIRGGRKLSGSITVGGSKNAALPIIFACVICRGVSIISDVPDIIDVNIALQILSDMGAIIERDGDSLIINSENMFYAEGSLECISHIRASSYLLGATLSRFGRARIQRFGGCNFDNRPIDMHVMAMCAVGAVESNGEFICRKLRAADIAFDKISVGATVNALLLTASASGTSRIYGYAREPHIFALIDFLVSAGARISVHTDFIEIEGSELRGGRARIIPDMIEAGTYVIASVVTDSQLVIRAAVRDQILSLTDKLSSVGVGFEFGKDTIMPFGTPDMPINIHTAPYPGFPTDLQPQLAPLLAAFFGGRIREGVWRARFGYLRELEKFGVKYELLPSEAIIYPSRFNSAEVTAPDLRGGAALVIAALASEGESIINSADVIGRGYENIVKKLLCVGADIEERNT